MVRNGTELCHTSDLILEIRLSDMILIPHIIACENAVPVVSTTLEIRGNNL